MVKDALLITVVGMFAVYAFLFLLMWCIQLMSFCIKKTEHSGDDMNKIAAVIGIALQRGSK